MSSIVVKINQRINSTELGCIQADNASYFDPITGVNLNAGNPTSGDLSGFSSNELANISNAVFSGVLTLVTGSLPAAGDLHKYTKYGLFDLDGTSSGPGWSGITGVAAGTYNDEESPETD